MTFVTFSQIAWLNSSLTRLSLSLTIMIPNEDKPLSLLLKNGSSQQPMPLFYYAKMAFHVSFTETITAFQGNLLNKISEKFLIVSLAIRKDRAYGEQTDYFDDANCIGWVRSGAEHQSPIAVLISNDQENSKAMFVGQEWADQTFIDLLENHPAQVTINAEGYGEFPVAAGSVSVWAAK